MRRDDRLVDNIDSIFDILQRCDTISIGLNGGGYPYIIPMTFGCELNNGKITVYFHSAGAGRKWDILNEDPRVCCEGHLYYKTVKLDDGSITAQYESVIGTGKAVLITDKDEKIKSLKVILDHYKQSGFPVTSCKGLSFVEVFKVELDEVAGKRNF
ncbi:MAG: pyridoxamine 5'-phosphate oxidase family protein [Clostridia bacterium]|nr:pyridoxamine 5'-phosphate oxidase family protein [Clostridia bacterium]